MCDEGQGGHARAGGPEKRAPARRLVAMTHTRQKNNKSTGGSQKSIYRYSVYTLLCYEWFRMALQMHGVLEVIEHTDTKPGRNQPKVERFQDRSAVPYG